MIALPSPIPYPVGHGPLGLPHWAYEALASAVGTGWPHGDEAATWDVADRWYALAGTLADPHDAAFAAAAQIMAGLGGSDRTGDGFPEAWHRLAGDENAPLNALVQIAQELGALVEECGTDIEAAKLEAWIEIGLFLTELIGMAVPVALTLGAAAPAAEGLITATRVAIQQIFERLVDRLGAPADLPPVPALLPIPTVAAPPALASAPPLTPPPAAPGELSPSSQHFRYARQARRAHEDGRRAEYLDFLESIIESTRARIRDLDRRADFALRNGSTLLGAEHRHRAAELHKVVEQTGARIAAVQAGESIPSTVDAEPQPWARPPADQPHHDHPPGGLRAPLAAQQQALVEAVPRDGDGRPARLADPRDGDWFALINGAGPATDPTRGLNCLDTVLALFDTYLHGRPRVGAPRTFDGYAHGAPARLIGGEADGLRRIREATGSDMQNLCPFVGGADPAEARAAVDAAIRNLTNHLHNCGHGTFAFIITDLEGGGCHGWAAVNQGGTVLFLDPQLGWIAEDTPLYRHQGRPDHGNIVSMDALVVNGHGEPAPLPFHGPGQWSR